jgi:hypothetical protein
MCGAPLRSVVNSPHVMFPSLIESFARTIARLSNRPKDLRRFYNDAATGRRAIVDHYAIDSMKLFAASAQALA